MNLTPLFRQIANPLHLPRRVAGPSIERQTPCSFCGHQRGDAIAQMHYWDLSQHNLVRCEKCDLVQIDPMLTDEDLSIGCKAFYQLEKKGHGLKELKRTCLRNFRKGIAFGVELQKLGFHPKRSLEMGAGDAYFSRGLQFVFRDLEVTCLDVVPKVLESIRAKHGFQTIQSAAEHLSARDHGLFDLIIARDFIEHVADPLMVIKSSFEVLRPGGLFHFITPNGFEDLWRSHAHWQMYKEPSELLINHVNYFEPRGLRKVLEDCGFLLLKWVIFEFKGFRRGKGWKYHQKMTGQTARALSAQKTFEELKDQSLDFSSIPDHEVMSTWWIQWPWLARKYCSFRHRHWYWVDADVGIGHEIDGLFLKPNHQAKT